MLLCGPIWLAAVDLAGVHGGALVHGAVLDEGVGADDAACADDRLAPQDGARKDHSARGNDYLRVDLHGAAVNDHAVCNVLHKDVLAGSLGGVQLCQGSGTGLLRNRILHKKSPFPPKRAAEERQKRRPENCCLSAPAPRCGKLCSDKIEFEKLQG